MNKFFSCCLYILEKDKNLIDLKVNLFFLKSSQYYSQSPFGNIILSKIWVYSSCFSSITP